MSTDLPARLKARALKMDKWNIVSPSGNMMREAAIEIERLEVEVAELKASLERAALASHIGRIVAASDCGDWP